VSGDKEYALSNISLRWMIQEIKRTHTGILFDEAELAKLKVPPTTGATMQGVVGEDVDARDAVEPISDELFKLKPKNILWWIFEIMPTKHTYQNKKGKLETKKRRHFGKGRQLPPNPLFHPSVKTRMDDSKLNYKPKANYDEGQVKFES